MDDAAPPSFLCPITDKIMRDPVTCADGHSYERSEIQKWFEKQNTSPKTGSVLQDQTLTPNHALRNSIDEWLAASFKLIDEDAVTINELIGRGSFKEVHSGRLRGHDDPIAVLKMKDGAKCEEEAATLVKLGRRPGLVRYLGICISGSTQLLLTELAPHGSLDTFLEKYWRMVKLEHKLVMLQQICMGICTQ